MSSDNGHYVIKMPKVDGYEWHVTYAQAIDNLFYQNENGNPIEVMKMLDSAPRIFDTEEHAVKYATQKEKFWQTGEGVGTEYGVCFIELPKSQAEYEKELMPAIYAELRDICNKIPAAWDDETRFNMISDLVELGKEYAGEK